MLASQRILGLLIDEFGWHEPSLESTENSHAQLQIVPGRTPQHEFTTAVVAHVLGFTEPIGNYWLIESAEFTAKDFGVSLPGRGVGIKVAAIGEACHGVTQSENR